jgi:hypothetical protein
VVQQAPLLGATIAQAEPDDRSECNERPGEHQGDDDSGGPGTALVARPRPDTFGLTSSSRGLGDVREARQLGPSTTLP